MMLPLLTTLSRVTWRGLSLAVIAAWTLMPQFLAAQEVTEPATLPQVLLIGDSISLGYTPAVQELMRGEARVVHHPGNAQHTGTGLVKLEEWLGDESWDVIHFNWGLWDLCYRHPEAKTGGMRDKVNGTLTTSLEDYERNLEQLVKRLEQTDAKLIWATTTPVPEGEPGRFAGAAKKYNAVAERVMKAHGVMINDLHAHASARIGEIQQPKDVHFTKEGSRYLAEQVVSTLRTALQDQTQ